MKETFGAAKLVFFWFHVSSADFAGCVAGNWSGQTPGFHHYVFHSAVSLSDKSIRGTYVFISVVPQQRKGDRCTILEVLEKKKSFLCCRRSGINAYRNVTYSFESLYTCVQISL